MCPFFLLPQNSTKFNCVLILIEESESEAKVMPALVEWEGQMLWWGLILEQVEVTQPVSNQRPHVEKGSRSGGGEGHGQAEVTPSLAEGDL